MKYIKNNQPQIYIPDILHVSQLDEDSLENYVDQSPIFEEYHKSLDYNFVNSTMIIFQYIEGRDLTKDRAISNLDGGVIFLIDSLHSISIVY